MLRRAVASLSERLPAGWSTRVVPSRGGRRPDAVLEIDAPKGEAATLLVVAKRVVEGRDVRAIGEQLTAYASAWPGAQGLVAARYLSSQVRARLVEEGLSYVDATGNVRIEVPSPGLFVSDRGADRDPWRGPGRPLGTLRGEPAARTVRALVDFSGPWSVRELVKVARVSTGAAYRVLDYLQREDLAHREPDARIIVPDWVRLLRRWSDDYGFTRNSQVSRWIAPRGLLRLLEQIATADSAGRYAVTGTLAAAEWAAYAPARAAMIYVDEAETAARTWGLRPADAGANVMLAEPRFEVVFERGRTNAEGVALAAPTQVVVDLMTGPGRSPSEAEELLRWMEQNEPSWRQ